MDRMIRVGRILSQIRSPFHFSHPLPAGGHATFSFFGSKSFPVSFGQHFVPPPDLLAAEEDIASPICSFLSGILIGSPASNTWPEPGAKRRTKDNCSHVFLPNLVQALWLSRENRQCKILNGEGSAGSKCHVPGKPRTGEKKGCLEGF